MLREDHLGKGDMTKPNARCRQGEGVAYAEVR